MSDTKSVMIFINRFGEQYADLFSLCFLWLIGLFGFISLIAVFRGTSHKERRWKSSKGQPIRNIHGLYLGYFKGSMIDERTGMVKSVLVDPTGNIDAGSYPRDEQGYLVLPSDAIHPLDTARIMKN
jgi:sporulation protein YlmC with PRC-barrel domain